MKALRQTIYLNRRLASNLVKTARVASLEIRDKNYLFLYGESSQNYADFLNDINSKANTNFNIVTDCNNKNIDLQTIISESSEQTITVKDSNDPDAEIVIDTSNSDKQAQLIILWMNINMNRKKFDGRSSVYRVGHINLDLLV